MALKIFVKISSLNNLSDARYCAGMMVDMIGFNIDPTTDHFVSADDFAEITSWVTGVQLAGEFYSASFDDMKEVLKCYPVDWIETDRMELVEQAQVLDKSIIFRMNIHSMDDLNALKPSLYDLDDRVKMVVIKSDNADLFHLLDDQINDYDGHIRLLKGYGIKASSDLHKFPGLELVATQEEHPGYKNYGQIMDVLEAIEED